MTPFRQLLRQPIRLIAVLLLLGMSATFFCLSGGVFASAQTTLDEVERNYITIAAPTAEIKVFSYSHHESPISDEMWKYMDSLSTDKSLMRGAYYQKFISAYSPSVNAIVSASEDGLYQFDMDSPYNRAIFVIRILSIAEETFSSSGTVSVTATATIEEVVRLHPGYQTRGTLHIYLRFASREEYDSLALAPGRCYLLNGTSYIDRDLDFRISLASWYRLPLSAVTLSDISYDIPQDILDGLKKADPEYKPVAWYTPIDEVGPFLEQWQVDQIDTCEIDSIQPDFDAPFLAADGTDTGLTIGQLCTNVFLTPLDTDWQTLVASDSEWQLALQEADTQYHTFPVIGTDLLESLYCFHQKQCFVTEGRSFTDREYKDGAKVCLISESTAQASNLHIGDEIDLSFYWGLNSSKINAVRSLWRAQPETYSAKLGFTGDAQKYKIIGIYRQANLWDSVRYSFTPNAVFVPAASIHEYCFTAQHGSMFTYVLQNGKAQAFQDALAAGGFPTNLVFCFDGGYSKIADTLRGFHKSAAQLFIAACATSLAALLVYQALFVNRQRRTMGLMLSLGAGRKRAAWFGCRTAILPIVMATAIGAAAGLLTMNATLRSLLSSVSEVLDTAMSSTAALGHAADAAVSSAPAAVPLAALAQCAFAALLSFLTISRMTRKSPLELIRKG